MMAERVGPGGRVLGIDLDADMGDRTRTMLRSEGHAQCVATTQTVPEGAEADRDRGKPVKHREDLARHRPSLMSAPSCSSSQRLRSSPPPKPVSSPRDPTTR